MSAAINTGGPAFPIADPFAVHQPGHVDAAKRLMEGMSLRDYFAAKVCAAVCTSTSADHDLLSADYRREKDGPTVAERVAETAYKVADAMLRERAKATGEAS